MSDLKHAKQSDATSASLDHRWYGALISRTHAEGHTNFLLAGVQRPEKFTPEKISEILTDRYKARMEERSWVVDENGTETPKLK